MDKIIRKTIKGYINEYYADQRLPFDDDFYGKKNQMEQYVDWLEDFGKYGNLPPSTLNFKEEINKAIDIILDKQLHGSKIDYVPNSKEEILERLDDVMFENLKFDENGNLYVERSIDLPNKAESSEEIYHQLINNYQNNVGGCWSYKKNGSNSYCTEYSNYGSNVILRGFIRTDDIDFIKTVLLNFHYTKEFEIRVKPFAKVALFDISIDGYSHTFKKSLIVSATYFGNGGKYAGEYAKIDDGFGNFTPINRKGETINIPNGCSFYDTTNVGLIIVSKLDKNEGVELYNLINSNGEFISKKWFYSISSDWHDGYTIVKLNKDFRDKDCNYLDMNGNLLFDKGFNSIEAFHNGLAIVVRLKFTNKVIFENVYNVVDAQGNIINDSWVSEYPSHIDDYSIVITRGDGFYNLIYADDNLKGRYISDKWFNGFDYTNIPLVYKVFLFGESFDDVKYNYLTKDGNLISPNEWFCDAETEFINGRTLVKKDFDGNVFILDTNGNLKETNFASFIRARRYLKTLSENTIFKSSVRKVLDEIKTINDFNNKKEQSHN